MADTDLTPDILSIVVGEYPDDRVVRAALVGVGCSATKNVALYTRTVVRPADRTTKMHQYYYQDSTLSTCQLAAMAWARMAGCADVECTGPYTPGSVPSDQIKLFERYNACIEVGKDFDVSGTLARSDSYLINIVGGNDVHCITVVSDVSVSPDGSTLTFDTVEGGQADTMGSSATGKFARTLVHKNGYWYSGARAVVRILQNRKLSIPFQGLPTPSGPADDQTDGANTPVT